MQFSEKLKKLRTDSGISQSELAAVLFVSRSAVAKWENGLGFPCEQSLTQIAEYFSVSKEYLCEDSSIANQAACDGAVNKMNNHIPTVARAFSFVATILLFVYATVISAFLVSEDCFEGGLSVLTEAMIIALIFVGVIMSVLELNEKNTYARFLAYGVGVGVGVFFACYFATTYLGYLKYGSFCVGAPVALIAANETMLFIVKRVCNVKRDCGESDKSAKSMLYICLAIATVMFGVCMYPLIIHTIEFYYDIGILIFAAGLFISVITALLIAITKAKYTQNALAFSFGALMFCGMLFIAPSLLDITDSGINPNIQSFYEYLAYEVTAMLACCTVLILALRQYCSYFLRAVSLRMKSVTVNN